MSNEKPAILLLEADPETFELYERELRPHYQVFRCEDAGAIFRLLGSVDIRVVVLEPAIAGGGGWRLVETLLSAAPANRPDIVICSTLDERRRGMNLGAAAYLVKPILPMTLLDTLRQVLES